MKPKLVVFAIAALVCATGCTRKATDAGIPITFVMASDSQTNLVEKVNTQGYADASDINLSALM